MKQVSILIMVVILMAGIAGIGCEAKKATIPAIVAQAQANPQYPPVPGNTPQAAPQAPLTPEQVAANNRAAQVQAARQEKEAEQIRLILLNSRIKGQAHAQEIKAFAEEGGISFSHALNYFKNKGK